MKALVLMRMVPDVVEELEISSQGAALDFDAVRMILNESDDHALEQALLLKERHGGQVIAVAPDAPEADDALFTALAKGADRAVKLTDLEPGVTARELAHAFAQALEAAPGLLPADLILTGAQSFGDLDGVVAPLVACRLGLPHVGTISGLAVDPAAGTAVALKEYAGGVRGEIEVRLPAAFGVQSAEKPPRYVPVAKVRAAMKSQRIEVAGAATMANGGGPLVRILEMVKPEPAGRAEMLEGSPELVAAKLAEILAAKGALS